MERDGSGVSALLGLDGFVVSAQVLDEASGEWWFDVRFGPRSPGCGRRPAVEAPGEIQRRFRLGLAW